METPTFKTREEILALNDRDSFDVYVPQWGCHCKVRELDMATITQISNSSRDENGKVRDDDYAVKVVLEGCIQPKFELQDYEWLKTRSNRAMTRLFNAIIDGKKN